MARAFLAPVYSFVVLLLIHVFVCVKQDSFEQMLKLQRMLVGHPEIIKAGRVSSDCLQKTVFWNALISWLLTRGNKIVWNDCFSCAYAWRFLQQYYNLSVTSYKGTILMETCHSLTKECFFLFLTGLSKRGNIDEVVSKRYAGENVFLGLWTFICYKNPWYAVIMK